MSVATITTERLNELCQSGQKIHLIDVRTPAEYRAVHVGVARNVPLDQLDAKTMAAEQAGSAVPLYVICKSGGRSGQACEKLAAAGFANVINVEGGTSAWEQAGFPVVRGQKAIALDRQVRMVAGSLVLIGAALGYFFDPRCIGLSAFIGAGLLFSGITDTCGMGMMLAKMPWNQVPQPGTKTESPPMTDVPTMCSLISPKG